MNILVSLFFSLVLGSILRKQHFMKTGSSKTVLNLSAILALVVQLFSLVGNAQNLVPNPSFEEITECPDGLWQITKCAGWESWRRTPDYFNACATEETYGELLINVPVNGFGYQTPASGEAYMGMAVFSDELNFPIVEASEIIGSQLAAPLEIGETYYLSMKVSWTPSGFKFITPYATNGIGMQFFTQTFDSDLDPVDLNNFAHLSAQSIIQDSVTWTTISGSFIADQAYTYVGIGNFFDGNNLEYINTIGPFYDSGAYYYVDDICVSKDPDCEVGVNIIELGIKCQHPYITDDKLKIDLSCNSEMTMVQIFTSSGRLVFERDTLESGLDLGVSDYNAGLYIIKVVSSYGNEAFRFVIP